MKQDDETDPELAFMLECARRVNRFIETYPLEARRVLAAYVPYAHELAKLHEMFLDEEDGDPPGATLAALVCALLQTPPDEPLEGYFMLPVIEDDQVSCFEVVSQDTLDDPLEQPKIDPSKLN